jgi:accessory gene regulator B
MIETLSRRMAVRMKEIHPGHPISTEVLAFALGSIINIFGTIVVSLTLAAFLGQLQETALAMLAFAALRAISGGRHLKTSISCMLVTSIGANLIPMAAKYIPFSKYSIILMTMISMALTAVFATRKIERQTRIPKKYYPLLRVLSVLLIATNFIFLNSIIAISHFIQSVLLIRRGGESR